MVGVCDAISMDSARLITFNVVICGVDELAVKVGGTDCFVV